MRKIALVSALVFAGIAVFQHSTSTHADAPAAQDKLEIYAGREVAAGRVIVKYRQAKDVAAQVALSQSLDADSDVDLGGTGARIIHSRTRSTAELVANLSERPDVLYAEPDYLAYGGALPNDTFFSSQQWGLRNTGQTIAGQTGTAGADIAIQQAWDVTTGAPNQVIGILDSGIDYNHPDLATNTWTSSTGFSVTLGGSTINCPPGTHGFNTINNTCNPLDDHNHGTNVAGIIGAGGNNGQGVAGVNWQTQLLALKWLNSSNFGFISDAIDAMEVAVQLKQAGANINVLSNSWFADAGSQALLDQIRRTQSNGMLFVAIAGNGTGNDGFSNGGNDNEVEPSYPSNFNEPFMLSVAATDNRDGLAFFSNWGKTTVHLGAPGNVIFSTLRNGTYGTFSGTSQAAPHVAGSAALLLSRCNLTAAGLKGVMLVTIDPLTALNGKTTSGGRLNVNRALSHCLAIPTIINETKFFVRQHYVDFLSREPDTAGFQFWTQNIDNCLGDTQCREVQRINTSGAFFLSIEFQQTGYLVYRMYKAAFNDLPGKPVAVTRAMFLPDTRTISNGVIVNQPGWEAKLEANKASFAQAFVQRGAFLTEYPQGMAASAYVDKLFSRTGITPSSGDRQAAINAYGSGDTAGRAAALRAVADNAAFQQSEFNKAFVLMQYFGYLQRDPDAAPDADFTGYNHWLGKLNQFNGDYIAAEMVKAFIESIEYRQRFSQ